MPDNKNILQSRLVKWLLIFAVWMFVAVFFTAYQYLQNFSSKPNASFWTGLSWQLASSFGWFALTPLILRGTRNVQLNGERFYRDLLVVLGLGILVVSLLMAFHAFVLPSLGYGWGAAYGSFPEAYGFMYTKSGGLNYLIYFVTLGVIFLTRYYHDFREQELRNSKLEASLGRARLQVLKMQLHPHFLFNTHNAISELIHTDPEAAEKTLTNLSDLLRIALEDIEVEEIPLRQELEFVEKYIEIEQIRFQERLCVEMQIDSETLDALVPKMLLQPLIENAVKHGVSPLAEGGTIRVKAARRGGQLLLRIEDDGVGAELLKKGDLVKGIGLANTKARLKHLYQNKQHFELVSKKGAGFLVKLEIPFRTGG